MATVSLTNYASQVAEIERQKKLAELLQQQAQQPIEIQSYKGIQAPIPWSAVLAKVLGQVGGQIKEARATKKAGELADLDRQTAAGLPEKMKHTVTMDNVRSLAGPQMQPTGMGGKLAALLSHGGQAAPVDPTAAPAMAPPAPAMAPPQAPITQSNLPPVAPNAASPASLVQALGGTPSQAIAPAPKFQEMGQGFVPAQRDVTLDRAPSPAEQEQIALRAMMSGGPMTEKMGNLLYMSAAAKQTKAEDRAFAREEKLDDRANEKDVTAEARAYGEAQRLKLIAEQTEKTRKFVENFSQYAPKDASGKLLVDPMQFAALAEAGDLAGAAKLYTDAGGDYRKAQEQIRQFNQTIALERQKLAEQADNNRKNRANAYEIAKLKGTDLRYIPSGGQKAIIGDRESLNRIKNAIKEVTANPSAFGLKNYAGNYAVNKAQPGGTTARAAVTAVSGIAFHDLAGAAQPAQEIERLKPHIPSVTDDQKSILAKLERLKAEIQSNLDGTEEFYSPQNGYRPVAESSSENVINYDNKGNPVP